MHDKADDSANEGGPATKDADQVCNRGVRADVPSNTQNDETPWLLLSSFAEARGMGLICTSAWPWTVAFRDADESSQFTETPSC